MRRRFSITADYLGKPDFRALASRLGMTGVVTPQGCLLSGDYDNASPVLGKAVDFFRRLPMRFKEDCMSFGRNANMRVGGVIMVDADEDNRIVITVTSDEGNRKTYLSVHSETIESNRNSIVGY